MSARNESSNLIDGVGNIVPVSARLINAELDDALLERRSRFCAEEIGRGIQQSGFRGCYVINANTNASK
jgi:Tfp pilus assembly protein PilW